MASIKQILLIDDDADDQEIFSTVIEQIFPSVQCEVAMNGEDALSKLRSQALPELIFLDLNMPLMNGQQFLKVVKKDNQLREIPIVILSTSSGEETIAETLSLGASKFITKPDKFIDWETKLRAVLSELSVKVNI
jgi:CheY-like chemotaxis protein